MTDRPRLIEHAFPLKQASLDSVHEKNVRHGHISTLHIWPARRPLAACRAALIATLLPDPGTPEERQKLCERIGGKVVEKIEKKKMPNGRMVERIKEETEGGILHWLGSEPTSGGKKKQEEYRRKAKFYEEELEWFRQEIHKAYGGLPAPRLGKFFIYVMKCNDDSFYIGQTDDIERRFEEHKKGRVQWTATRQPLQIIHWEEFDSREEAVKREQELKTGFGRKWLKREYEAGRTRQAGRAPRVLDPFAGGGAIPLEAMRLGCEVTAVDINPVAWFILKCTLEYPQKLAGKTHPLPDFILEDEEFMAAFYKAHPELTLKAKRLHKIGETRGLFEQEGLPAPVADLAWHVRAWGKWVLNRARRELAKFYPTYAHFEKVGQAVGQASRLPADSASRLPTDSVSDRLSSALDVDALVPMFLNPVSPTEVTQRRLPHWRQESVLDFVTFRLADSLPQERVEQLRVEREAWLKAHAEPWSKEAIKEYYRLFSDRVEDWLNAGHGECLLRDPGVRKVVSDALRHFDGTRYDLGAWCVMPNHVHALVRPRPGHELSNILHSWKSFTAHEINKRLGRKGEVWQHEGYDHIVRNPQSLWRIEQYILNNPIGAGLGVDEFALSPLTEISVGSFTISGGRFATETVAPLLMQLVPLKDDGTPDIDALNAEFSEEYLADKRNPRWVAKPTVAYLWARTVTCKNCRATVPLLKTRWLCKKANKRVLLTIQKVEQASGLLSDGNRDGCPTPTLIFGIENDVPVKGGNAAQRREHDKRVGAGAMSRSGAKCPCCPAIMTMEDIRIEGIGGRLGAQLVAVITDTPEGKGYRSPMAYERDVAAQAEAEIDTLFSGVRHGRINEPLAPASTRSISCQLYGLDSFDKLFTSRQHVALGHFMVALNAARAAMGDDPDETEGWHEATQSYLMLAVDRLADYSNALCTWHMSKEQMRNLFGRFALPMTWDFCECSPVGDTTGGFTGAVNWIAMALSSCLLVGARAPRSHVQRDTASGLSTAADATYDMVITDPPYYEAISYADLSDVFYVMLRRMSTDNAFVGTSTPKEQEIVQHIRADKDRRQEKQKYERMMADAFRAVWRVLRDTGRFVIVFAHKHPDAWETLVSAMIQAGFVVDGSWPIQTEMANRTRGLTAAALASSVWLVCKKRPATARPGWDNKVMDEMRANISTQLREFWDAGIRGPDFVWAATGPALEAYSKHPIVKKANDPGKTMQVGEFLSHVRRMVVDFVVGQVLVGQASGLPSNATEVEQASGLPSNATETVAPPVDNLDAPTAYYLLHRHDFGLEEAPSGACILYATACGLSDSELEATWDVLVRTGGSSGSQYEDDENEENEDTDLSACDAQAGPDAEAGSDSASDSGSKVKLKTWAQRKHKSMGYEAPGGQPVPLIDRIHRLMHLWRAGDVLKVDEYLDEHGLRRQELFKRLVQSLIELSRKDGESQELQTLESLSNHVQAKGATPEDRQARLFELKDTETREGGDAETRGHGDTES